MPELRPALDSIVDIRRPLDTFQTARTDAQGALQPSYSFQQHLAYGAAAIPAGLADTVGVSLGLFDDDSVSQALAKQLPTLGKYYKENKAGVQTVSDLAGMFIPGMLGVKAFRAGGALYNATTKTGKASRYLEALFSTGKSRQQMMQAVLAHDLEYTGAANAGLDLLASPVRKSLIRQATTTRVGDILKESAAFELGVYATMNDSQTLYPDEFSTAEIFALNAFFPGAISLGEFAMIRRVARQSSNAVAGRAMESINPLGVNLNDVMSRKMNRDLAIVADSIVSIEAKAGFSGAGVTEAGKANYNRAQITFTEAIKANVEKLFHDAPLAKVTHSARPSEAQMQTILTAQTRHPFTLLGTVSIEPVPRTPADITAIFEARTARIAELGDKRQTKIAELEKLLDDNKDLFDLTESQARSEKISKLQKDIDALTEEQSLVESLEYYVLERDGTMMPLQSRKNIFHDYPAPLTRESERSTEKKIVSTFVPPEIGGGKTRRLGVGNDMRPIIPPPAQDKVVISRLNVTKVVDKRENLHTPEFFRHLLHDLAEDYHFAKGERGKNLFAQLPSNIQEQVKNWTGSSRRSSSKIRQWFDDDAPEAKILYDHYAPFRLRLRELADEDGTVPLLRGENAETAMKEDVVSMTSSPSKAKAFARPHVIVKRVHVDDVIMPIGGLGDEWEYIVKNNKRRENPDAVKGVKLEQLSPSSWESLDLAERSTVYYLLGKQIEGWKPGSVKTIITENDHHTVLDAFLELAEKHPGDINALQKDFQLPKIWTSLDDVEYASLRGKFTDFVRLMQVTEAVGTGKLKLKPSQRMQLVDIIKMHNLPGSISPNGEYHPLINVFIKAFQDGHTQLSNFARNLDDLKALVDIEATFPALLDDLPQARELRFRGHMLDASSARAPSVTVQRPRDLDLASRDSFNDAIAQQRAFLMNDLRNAQSQGAELVALLVDYFNKNPNVSAVRAVEGLQEGSMRGRGAFFQQTYAAAENPTLVATRDVTSGAITQFRAAVGKIFDPYLDTFNRLQARGAHADLETFNLFVHTRRQGWDLTGETVPLDGGRIGFVLKASDFNRKRWRKTFNEAMPEGDKDAKILMPAPTKSGAGYTPLGITQLAMEGVQAVSELGLIQQRNTNYIRKMMGLGNANTKEFWVPPKNFSRSEIVFVHDGHSVRGTIAGRTLSEARERAANEIAQSEEKGLFTVDYKDVDRYMDLWDEAFAKMLDFTDPLMQTGRSKGTSVFEVIDTGPGVLKDMMGSMTKNFESILRRGTTLYFEPQINYARKLHRIAGSEASQKGQSIWQHYLAAMYDNPTLNPNDNIGRAYYAVENVFDDLLNKAWEKLRVKTPGQIPDRVLAGNEKAYQNLDKVLGQYNPFTDAVDYISRTHKISPPPNMKRTMGKLNHLTGLLTLRLFEVGHSILTLTSLGATMPGVIKALNMSPIERAGGATGRKEWLARISAIGTEVGDDIAMPNPTRIIASTFHDLFTEEGRQVWKRAGDKGYMDQVIVEMVRTLTAPASGYAEGLLRKYGRLAVFLSDESERLARGISFMAGHRIATKHLGIQSEDAAFAFAHKFANQVIGNYSPNNRPRMFQGATGMPLGLFMTFMWNYYQRIFSYIGDKQIGALGWQYFSQAAVFGAGTVPGFQQFADLVASNYDGSSNLIDGMQNRFGTEATEWFLAGTLSNLPKLFGAEDGIGLYTRGDVTARNIPTLANPLDAPAFRMIANGLNGIRETLEMFREGGASRQQLAEITANYSQSRFLRNMAQMYTGAVTDRRGQLVGETPTFEDVIKGDIQNEMALVARLVGMRTLKESMKVSAWMRVRNTEQSQMYRLGALRDNVRAMVRGDEITSEEMTRVVANYLRYGGRPEYFANWFAENAMKAQVDKSLLKLKDIANDPTRSYDVQRLLSALVLAPNDPEFD